MVILKEHCRCNIRLQKFFTIVYFNINSVQNVVKLSPKRNFTHKVIQLSVSYICIFNAKTVETVKTILDFRNT